MLFIVCKIWFASLWCSLREEKDRHCFVPPLDTDRWRRTASASLCWWRFIQEVCCFTNTYEVILRNFAIFFFRVVGYSILRAIFVYILSCCRFLTDCVFFSLAVFVSFLLVFCNFCAFVFLLFLKWKFWGSWDLHILSHSIFGKFVPFGRLFVCFVVHYHSIFCQIVSIIFPIISIFSSVICLDFFFSRFVLGSELTSFLPIFVHTADFWSFKKQNKWGQI